MRGAVYVNGTISSPETAVVPVFDHGFMYGEGVYEVLRTYNGVPFLFDRHIARLRRSAQHLQLDVPFGDQALQSWVNQTVAASGSSGRAANLASAPASQETAAFRGSRISDDPSAGAPAAESDGEAYIRILITRGIGDLTYDVRATPVPSVVIVVKPLDDPRERMPNGGVGLALVPILRNHPGSVNPIIKSNNLLNNAMSMQEANRRGADEALMCNYRGELSECSQSNVFLVRDGVALTPASQAGLLEGITRGFLFEVGKAIGVEVRDATLWPSDLASADEVFITSTTREISPVIRIDDRTIGDGRPGPVTMRLAEAYHRMAVEMSRAASSSRLPASSSH